MDESKYVRNLIKGIQTNDTCMRVLKSLDRYRNGLCPLSEAIQNHLNDEKVCTRVEDDTLMQLYPNESLMLPSSYTWLPNRYVLVQENSYELLQYDRLILETDGAKTIILYIADPKLSDEKGERFELSTDEFYSIVQVLATVLYDDSLVDISARLSQDDLELFYYYLLAVITEKDEFILHKYVVRTICKRAWNIEDRVFLIPSISVVLRQFVEYYVPTLFPMDKIYSRYDNKLIKHQPIIDIEVINATRLHSRYTRQGRVKLNFTIRYPTPDLYQAQALKTTGTMNTDGNPNADISKFFSLPLELINEILDLSSPLKLYNCQCNHSFTTALNKKYTSNSDQDLAWRKFNLLFPLTGRRIIDSTCNATFMEYNAIILTRWIDGSYGKPEHIWSHQDVIKRGMFSLNWKTLDFIHLKAHNYVFGSYGSLISLTETGRSEMLETILMYDFLLPFSRLNIATTLEALKLCSDVDCHIATET